jgi:hypothetical protein
MRLFLQKGVDDRAAFGVRFIAPQHVAVAQRAAVQADRRAGEGGVPAKKRSPVPPMRAWI